MSILQILMARASSTYSVSLSPTTASGTSVAPSTAFTQVLATPSGGVGPYTYLWTLQSGSGVTLTNTTTATVTITTNTGVSGQFLTGVVRCTVTDTGNGSVTTSANANYELEVV